MTENPNEVLDEQKKETERFLELNAKTDRTEEETTELDEIKANYGVKVQKKIGEYSYKAKLAEENLERERQRVAELEEKLSQQHQKAEPVISNETVDAGGEKFFTDKALRTMIAAGKLSDEEAFSHQSARIEAVAADKAYKRIKGEQEKVSKQEQLKSEANKVFEKYPHWKQGHAQYNPNDPMFIEANKLYSQGVSPLQAMQYAEKLVGKKPNIDISDGFNEYPPSAPSTTPKVEKEVPLTGDEREAAIQVWTLQNNPATGRPYTEKEAIAKAQKARNARTQYLNRK